MSEWMKMGIASLDTETTGLDTSKARIIEVGIVCYRDGKQEDTYSRLINPGMEISSKITQITGISPDDLKGKPRFQDVADQILKCLENRIFVAYNAPYDLGMLRAEFARIGRAFPDIKVLDPLVLAREVLHLKSYKLGLVADHLGINMERAHRAKDDADAAAQILYRIANKLPQDLNELIQAQEQWKNAQDAKRRQWRQGRTEVSDMLNPHREQDTEQRLGPAYIYSKETYPDPLIAFVKDYASRVGRK